jgi:hypothetical protein
MVNEMTPENMICQEPLVDCSELVDEMIDSRETLNGRLRAITHGLLPTLMQRLFERNSELLMRRTVQQALRRPQIRCTRTAASAALRAAA